MVEQRPFKALVVGSNPTRPTSFVRMKAWVYILRGSSGRHYIGSTADVERRLKEHTSGSCHTTQRIGANIELVAHASCTSLPDARALERRLKRMKNPSAAIAFLESSSSPD